jgi:hypothetical protein
MNDIDDRERVQGQTSSPDYKNDHVPARIGVYDRPERKRPSLLQLVIAAVLLLVAAVILYQLIF